MTSAFVQAFDATGGGGTSTTVLTVPSDIPIGHLLVIGSMYPTLAAPITGISDTQGNTYNFVNSVAIASGTIIEVLEVWYTVLTTALVAATPDTITIQYSANSASKLAVCGEFSGILNTSPLDKSANKQIAAPSSGTMTNNATAATTQATEMVVAFFGTYTSGSGGAITPGSGYSSGVDYTGPAGPASTPLHLFMEYQHVSVTGAQTASATAASTPTEWAASTATFKDAPARQARHPALNFQNPAVL